MLCPQGAAADCGSVVRHLWGMRPALLKQKNTILTKIVIRNVLYSIQAHQKYKYPVALSQWCTFTAICPGTLNVLSHNCLKAPHYLETSFKTDKQIEWTSIWWCSSETQPTNLTWKVSCVEIISVRQCRLAGWREQLVAGLFLLLQEDWALVSAVQSSS